MEDTQRNLAYIGATKNRSREVSFGLRPISRLSHTYIAGRTGTGKSTLVETLARQDLASCDGFALLDPHGDLAEKLLTRLPNNARSIIYFNAACKHNLPSFNPLQYQSDRFYQRASGLVEAFRHVWADSWGPRLEHILRNCLLVLLEQPQATLGDISRLLLDDSYRRQVGASCRNPQVRAFWLVEYERYPARLRADAIAPLQNKIGAFLASPVVQRIVNRGTSDFDFRHLMDNGGVLICNLAKGAVGEDVARLLGALLLSGINTAALSRADLPASERRPFYVYIDEFQTFATGALASMLAELRKYGVGLILAHQHLSQLDESVRDAILGNVGTTIVFRVGVPDAEILAKEFSPEFGIHDLVNLPNHHMYLKLMIDGTISRPFSARTLSPDELERLVA